jgi:hypothetical protein
MGIFCGPWAMAAVGHIPVSTADTAELPQSTHHGPWHLVAEWRKVWATTSFATISFDDMSSRILADDQIGGDPAIAPAFQE